MECAQLVKANSIEGCKKKEVYVVYTRWRNLKKTSDMVVGEKIEFILMFRFICDHRGYWLPWSKQSAQDEGGKRQFYRQPSEPDKTGWNINKCLLRLVIDHFSSWQIGVFSWFGCTAGRAGGGIQSRAEGEETGRTRSGEASSEGKRGRGKAEKLRVSTKQNLMFYCAVPDSITFVFL